MYRSRRKVLAAASGLVGGLAGCTDTGRDRADPPSGGPTRGQPTSDVSGSTTDPTVTWLRNPAGTHIVAEDASGLALGAGLLTDADDGDALAFADGVPAEQVEAAEAFLDRTDFETETVFLLRSRVRSCRQYRLQSVAWDADRIEYDYCWELRPPDRSCEAGGFDGLLGLVRVPAVLDPHSVTGTSSSGSGCGDTDTDYEAIDPDDGAEGDA